MSFDWLRTYDYINEYLDLVYNFYSKDAVAYLVTYYNIDTENTVWEDQKLKGGFYDLIGTYSGVKWNKILLLPVYFPEEITTAFTADERGYVKDNETRIVIPSTYGITPYVHDFIKLTQNVLRPTNDTYPIFQVTGVEKSVNTDFTFWKLKVESSSHSTTDIDNQISDMFSFFEYTKKIYPLETSTFLSKLITKSKLCQDNIKSFYDKNSGLYYL
jgi:hypothetical protein